MSGEQNIIRSFEDFYKECTKDSGTIEKYWEDFPGEDDAMRQQTPQPKPLPYAVRYRLQSGEDITIMEDGALPHYPLPKAIIKDGWPSFRLPNGRVVRRTDVVRRTELTKEDLEPKQRRSFEDIVSVTVDAQDDGAQMKLADAFTKIEALQAKKRELLGETIPPVEAPSQGAPTTPAKRGRKPKAA